MPTWHNRLPNKDSPFPHVATEQAILHHPSLPPTKGLHLLGMQPFLYSEQRIIISYTRKQIRQKSPGSIKKITNFIHDKPNLPHPNPPDI